MKRASVQDFDELNADFMSELWGDPKLLRVEGGIRHSVFFLRGFALHARLGQDLI